MTTPNDKAFEMLLELGSPTERGTRNELLDRALNASLALTDADAAIILTTSRGREERIALHSGSSVLAVLQPPQEGSEVIRSLAQSYRPLLLDDLSEEAFASTDGCPGIEAGPVMFSPLRQFHLSPAYIAAYRRRGRARFTTHDIRSMLLLGAWLNGALEIQRLASHRERLVVTDDLTNVYNFRFLKVALGREIHRAHRFGHEVSIAKIAVDHVAPEGSAPMDGFSQAALLSELAMVLARQVRSFDILGKCDRDTFLLLLPHTDRDNAVDVAERARAALEAHSLSEGAAGSVSPRMGVASAPKDGADVPTLLKSADRALERAKQQGRSCVATLPRRAA